MELGPLTDDALTGSFRLWQRKKGHRYSLDDVLTAYEALEEKKDANNILDLGCGIGSVLLMLAYKNQKAKLSGIEAQSISFSLLRKNIQRNQVENRITIIHGDLRDEKIYPSLNPPFDLISGTPPYKIPGTATPSPDSQKQYARIEMRGGIEAYLNAASKLIKNNGIIVICFEAGNETRALNAAKQAKLYPKHKRLAIPREGAKPLFEIWSFQKEETLLKEKPSFIARDKDGNRTKAYFDLRSFFDLPPTSKA